MSLRDFFAQRILLLDGGMGSMIQEYELSEEDFSCSELRSIKGNIDALSVTRPDVILDIHRRYIKAGADVITTNTFSSQRISQQEYNLEDKIEILNRAAVRLARKAANEAGRKVYVIGDVGPTSKMLSMSEDVNNPAARSITFDELEKAYIEQISMLVEEGVDGILMETIFDTLNAKAAISAYEKVKGNSGCELLLSLTVSDTSGRTLSGQTVSAFVVSVMHAKPLCLGLNCGFGADSMLPYLRQLSEAAPCYVSCHPNAGLPNQLGNYDDSPEDMAAMMQPYLSERLVNMIGGCCGTTPDHIAAMRRLIDENQSIVRTPTKRGGGLHLAGLEPLYAPVVSAQNRKELVVVGERCNVAGSRKFLRLIIEKKYEEALDIARNQIKDGAQVIDVNMDDGLLDAEHEMVTFLNLVASDPEISRVPIMIDSSRFEVIEAGLKCLQGKGIVNSISLKMGEAEFIEHARTVHRLGAAIIAMCFDEDGQATDYDRRIGISKRMYDLLTKEADFDPNDIIFDPNVLTVATGMTEHNAYANNFIRATRWITDNLNGARVSGGLSNLSFAFRGNNYLRESMHSVFLHHARANGMGMAIMNPATEVEYSTIPLELRMAITEVLLNTSDEATEELIAIAQRMNDAQTKAKEAGEKYDAKAIFTNVTQGSDDRQGESAEDNLKAINYSSPEERLKSALQKGVTSGIEADILSLIERGDTPIQIISGPLMDGMNEVGRLFGEGKMFLPQVVKTARTMKKAVDILQPFLENTQSDLSQIEMGGTVVLATVKGDVHDIGKNIVNVVLACNGFKVIDLGVMVPSDIIVKAAIENKADCVCLSGLITPSLEEMCHVARVMQDAGLSMPIIVGGATTSPIHTAIKIAPCYEGPVFHVRDASTNPVLIMRLLDPAQRNDVIAANRIEQQRILKQNKEKAIVCKSSNEVAISKKINELGNSSETSNGQNVAIARTIIEPPFVGTRVLPSVLISELIPFINWTYFYWAWRVKEGNEEAIKLREDADEILSEIANDSSYALRATQAFYPAIGMNDRIRFSVNHNEHESDCPCCSQTVDIMTPRLKNASQSNNYSLSDFVSQEKDYVGAFAITVSQAFVNRLEQLKKEEGNGDYNTLLLQTLGDRLVEATSEYLGKMLKDLYHWNGIRPAIGYPSLPDQLQIFQLGKLINFEAIGITLTENGAMYPQASVCGLYISNDGAHY